MLNNDPTKEQTFCSAVQMINRRSSDVRAYLDFQMHPGKYGNIWRAGLKRKLRDVLTSDDRRNG